MKKPWGIKLAVATLIFEIIINTIAIILLILTATLLPPEATQIYSGVVDSIGYMTPIYIAGILMVIPMIITIIFAKFLYDGNRYAWGLMLIFVATALISNLTQFNMISLGFNILILLGLLHRETIEYIDLKTNFKGWKLEEN